MAGPRLLLMNGTLVAYEDARVHALSTAMKYAASVHGAMRAYRSDADRPLYVFRLGERLRRLPIPPRVKAAANCQNSRLALLQARAGGHDGAILLGADGRVADEACFRGTAAEVTPVLSIDRHPVGDGAMGPLAAKIRDTHFRAVRDGSSSRPEWPAPVYA